MNKKRCSCWSFGPNFEPKLKRERRFLLILTFLCEFWFKLQPKSRLRAIYMTKLVEINCSQSTFGLQFGPKPAILRVCAGIWVV